MSQLPSATPAPGTSQPDATAPVVEPGFDVKAHAFWVANRTAIYGGFAAIALGLVAWSGWQYFAAMREETLQQDFAKAAARPEQLAAFAEANPSHPLAGVAYLQLADQKFSAAAYREAAPLYTKAAGVLKNEALLGRARIGAAVSQLNGGDQAAGEAALKAVGADTALLKSVRAEANYHLASLAVDAGKVDEARKLIEETTKLDLAGPWSQRATVLLGTLPPPAILPAAK